MISDTNKNPTALLTKLLLILTPLLFLPTTLNFFATNKQTLIIFIAVIMLAFTAFSHLTKKSHQHATFILLRPLTIFFVVIIANLLFISEARIESLTNRGSLFLALPLISYFIATTSNNASKLLKSALNTLVVMGTLLALHGILQLTFLYQLNSLPIWMQSKSFTPVGSPLILLTFLVPTLIATLTWATSAKNSMKKSILFITAGVQLAAITAYVSLMLPGKELAPILLPISAGWSLSLDAIKGGKTLLLGTGLANFPSLFTQVKPLFLNQTPLWASVQQASTNEFFQLLTTTGVLGLSAFLLIILGINKTIRTLPRTPLTKTLIATIYTVILTMVLLPANIITYTLLFVFAGLAAAKSNMTYRTTIPLRGNTNLFTTIVLATIVLAVGYGTTRVYSAEYEMRQAQVALTNGDAAEVYARNIRAIQLVPQMTNYHVSFSQINLTLASSLSQQESLSDQQREQITILVQRSIEQARTAAQLRPSSYTSWQNLGNIYRNLINVAEGADNFAIQYYAQAVNLNPASPLLRVDYGGLFYQLALITEDPTLKLELLTRAANQFQTATQLRPTYANGYYNLAKTLELADNIPGAYQAMQQVVAALDPNLPDYATATIELETLRLQLPPTEDQQPLVNPTTTKLSEPEPLPSPLPGGPIKLPEEEELITPSPTPEPSTTPQPSPSPEEL